jgi:hypothetical protein
MVSIPLRSNMIKARFSVTVPRVIGTIYAAQLPAVSASGGRVEGAKVLPGRVSSTLVCCPKCSQATPAMAAIASTTTRNPNNSIAHQRAQRADQQTNAFDTGSPIFPQLPRN